MKRVVYLTGKLLSLAALVYLVVRLVQEWGRIPSVSWSPLAVAGLVGTTVLVTVSVPISAGIWKMLLAGGGVPIRYRHAFTIMAISQMWRYLPGIFLHQVGQVAMARRAGIALSAAALTVGLQTALNMLTNAGIAVLGLTLAAEKLPPWLLTALAGRMWLLWAGGAAALAVLAVGLASPPVRRWTGQRMAYLHPRGMLAAVALYILINAMVGMALSLLLRTFWPQPFPVRWYEFAWGFALAWVIGFLIPGAPAGLGIREAVLVELYANELGAGVIIGLGLLLRALMMVGDLTAFGVAVWLSRGSGARATGAGAA
ncbi:MAG: lysylphosphatidylglycerol synthase domain-containing protein [SAR324 cluster bacterium]